MKKQLLTLFSVVALSTNAQTFSIAGRGSVAEICIAQNDYEGVKIAGSNLANDIRMAYDGNVNETGGRHIFVGTIGHSYIIDSLVRCRAIDVDEIRGQWERYIITANGGDLVIAGSDRRGTIFGAYEISRRIGVSAWTWWADVPVVKRKSLSVDARRYVKPSPSVKYRGIFINDEDWGMKPWASNTYERSLGDIGPKTYERVCELILRLGGNMLAPAMHACTGAFYTHPESKVVADKLGVIITTSHCEPMLFNNACTTEWNKERDGEWNYRTNRKTILGKFANRVAEAYEYDNIYTIAMRGVHDEGMRGQATPQERVAVLNDVIRDQRNLLELFTQKKASEVPQIFVPYKETLDVYDAGLRVPDDVTIVWPDDNYGYMKRLSNDSERKRSGGSGVYYHLSYLGTPHDYLWLCTTAPSFMYEELSKAYRSGADRYWLLNVGDIKPMELDVQLFFDMADNIGAYDNVKANRAQQQMLREWFPQLRNADFQSILDDYYRLAWIRKPEYMGWEWQWDSADRCKLRDTEFSFEHYNSAQQRLADYQRIASRCRQMMNSLHGDAHWAFFQMLAYSVMATEQMNRKFLLAQLNHELYASAKYAEANWAAEQSQAAADSIEALNHTYNTMLGGKWSGMMTVPPGYVALYQNMPVLHLTEGVGTTRVDLAVRPERNKTEGCRKIPVDKPLKSQNVNILEGIGYDWQVAQLGDVMSGVGATPYAEYALGYISADEVTLHIYVLPFFPIDTNSSNRIKVSIDGGASLQLENKFEEWSYSWKDQVLKNGYEYVVTFPLNGNHKNHTLRIEAVDMGQIVERIIVDWGGLKKTYLGM